MWRLLLARLSAPTRVRLGFVTMALIIARICFVGAALLLARGDVTAASFVAAFGSAAFVVQRVLASSSRVRVECDLHRASSEALLAGDVLEVPHEDLQRILFESNALACGALAGTLPSFVADALSSLLLAPIIVTIFPPRVLALAALGLVVALVSLVLLRRVTQGLQDRVLSSYQEVADVLLVAIEGRLELVARGGERAFSGTVNDALTRYAVVAERSGWASALLGRAPLAAGAGVVLLAAILDGASRAALVDIVSARALVLAATLPALLGALLGAHELVRARVRVAPLLAILEAPPRPDVAVGLADAPMGASRRATVVLPAEIAAERVTFSYEKGGPRVLDELSFVWPVGRPLVLTGPNGSGKSTLLRLLAGLRPPTEGHLYVSGTDLRKVDGSVMRADVALLPQRPYLGEGYRSIRDAMQIAVPGASDEAMTTALARTDVLAALRARAADPLDVRVGELSSGQRQRTAFARILLQDARLVLLDEPDANLDRAGIARVSALIDELVSSGAMVAVAAHTTELSRMNALCIELSPPLGDA